MGIDLGTAFTSAAVRTAQGTKMVPLGPDVIVPSVAAATTEGTLLTGSAATSGDPARTARGFKRRLGDPTPLRLGGASYSPAALMAAQLRDVLATVSRAHGGPPSSIVLTCPAIWGPYRREQFAQVPRLADVPRHDLVTEPEAAATHYSRERRLGDGEVVAVYDLGGGTFDTTILRVRGGRTEILGTPEGIEHMGGIDFDDTLLGHIDDRLDGAIQRLDPDDPDTATTLAAIRATVVRAKEDLSLEPDVRLEIPLPGGPREVTVTRAEFNEMITPSVRLTIDALRRTVVSAGLRTSDLSGVLLAGGSSRIPLVSQLVSQELGKPVRVTLHPKFTVALGAATITARQGPAAPKPVQAPPPIQPPIQLPEQARDANDSRTSRTPPRRNGRKRFVAATVAIVAAVAATTVLALTLGDDRTERNGTTAGTSTGPAEATSVTPPRESLRVFDGAAVEPWVALIASPENWQGTEFGPEGARQNPIAATPDGDGVRVSWSGDQGQFYLQSGSGPLNFTSYVDSSGALVFDVVVHEAPTAPVTVGVHCEYPCAADLPVTTLLRNLGTEQKATVKIPLTCFTSAGLDATKVNTPFLLATGKPFDATISDIRWEAGAAEDDDATPCDQLD